MLEERKATITFELQRISRTLAKPVQLDLDLNDLRIIVGSLRLAAYMTEVDDEPYLDAEGVELKERLEQLYAKMLEASEPKGEAS